MFLGVLLKLSSTKCQPSYLIVGSVLHRRSELLFLLFYLLVCPICIYFISQLAILLSNRFLPQSFTIQSTFISTQIFSILIALIRSAIPPTISFDLIFYFLLRSQSTYVFLCRRFSQTMR